MRKGVSNSQTPHHSHSLSSYFSPSPLPPSQKPKRKTGTTPTQPVEVKQKQNPRRVFYVRTQKEKKRNINKKYQQKKII